MLDDSSSAKQVATGLLKFERQDAQEGLLEFDRTTRQSGDGNGLFTHLRLYILAAWARILVLHTLYRLYSNPRFSSLLKFNLVEIDSEDYWNFGGGIVA